MVDSGDATQPVLEKLQVLHDDLARSHAYEGRRQEVEALLGQTREVLEGDADLGKWEREQLDYADVAIRSNFLKLAVFYAIKAVLVSRLPKDEYEQGYGYTQRE